MPNHDRSEGDEPQLPDHAQPEAGDAPWNTFEDLLAATRGTPRATTPDASERPDSVEPGPQPALPPLPPLDSVDADRQSSPPPGDLEAANFGTEPAPADPAPAPAAPPASGFPPLGAPTNLDALPAFTDGAPPAGPGQPGGHHDPVGGARRRPAWLLPVAALAGLALVGAAVWGGLQLFGPKDDAAPAAGDTAAAPAASPSAGGDANPDDATDAANESAPSGATYPLSNPGAVTKLDLAYTGTEFVEGAETAGPVIEVSGHGCQVTGFLADSKGDFQHLGDDPAAAIIADLKTRGETDVKLDAEYEDLGTVTLTDTAGTSVELLKVHRTSSHDDGQQRHTYVAVHPFPDSGMVMLVTATCGTSDFGAEAFTTLLTDELEFTLGGGAE